MEIKTREVSLNSNKDEDEKLERCTRMSSLLGQSRFREGDIIVLRGRRPLGLPDTPPLSLPHSKQLRISIATMLRLCKIDSPIVLPEHGCMV